MSENLNQVVQLVAW